MGGSLKTPPPGLNRVKPLVERNKLVISSEDMEPTTFDSINQAAKSIGVGYMVIRYAREKGKNSFKRTADGKIFSVNWC